MYDRSKGQSQDVELRCYLATSSDIRPEECRGPYQRGVEEEIDPDGRCLTSSEGYWKGGCFIKSGKQLR